MPVLLVILGVLAALVAGAVALFTFGTIGAVAVVALILGFVIYAVVAKALQTAALAVAGLALVGALGYGGFTAYQLYGSLGDFDGPADPPDAAALASANAKIDAAQEQGGFNVELTEAELGAVLQDTLQDAEDNPIRRIDLTIVDGEDGGQGSVDFLVTFKNGSLTGEGSVAATLDAGRINLDIQDVSLGRMSLPGIAKGAMEDLVETVLDLNERLAESGASVQAITIGGGSVRVVGTGDGSPITGETLLGAIAENAEALAGATTPPAEVIGPGDIDSTSSDGAAYVVAIGDSLAANVGVPSAREGMVSRFVRVVSERDGQAYGLRNFGVSGETTGTMIHGGQLDTALEFIRDNQVAYVVVSIGANDLLGHVGSEDCADSLDAPACQARLQPSLDGFRANFDRIMGEIEDAAGDAQILVLTIYNPFSLGFGGAISLEETSNDATEQLNAIAAEVAAAHGATVADGYVRMEGTAASTTHMLENPPDVHPNSSGYDLLAQALAEALS